MDQPPIATGRTADIYAWESNQILKLFHDWVEPRFIEQEAQIGKMIHAAGVNAPAVGEIISVQSKIGLTYERIEGRTMVDQLMRRPWQVDRLANRFAISQADIHNRTIPDIGMIPNLRSKWPPLLRRIEALPMLSDSVKSKLISSSSRLKPGDALCHGDYHPNNLLIDKNGDPVIIDWPNAIRANRWADVARTTILLKGAERGEIPWPPIRWLASRFHHTYLARYRALSPDLDSEYRDWLPVMAALRLLEGIPEQTEWIVSYLERWGEAG